MTLKELQTRFPHRTNLKYEPKVDCKVCKGSGVKRIRRHKVRTIPCICLQVSHDCCEDAGEALSKFAKKMLGRDQVGMDVKQTGMENM